MNAITFKRLFRRSDVSLCSGAIPQCKGSKNLRRLCAISAGALALTGVLGFTSFSRPVLTFAKYSYIETKGTAQCNAVAFVGTTGDKKQSNSDSLSSLIKLDGMSQSYSSEQQLFAEVSSQVTSGGCSTEVEGNSEGLATCFVNPVTDLGHGLIKVDFEAFSPCNSNVGCTNSYTEMSYGSEKSPNMMQINVPFTLPVNRFGQNYKVNIDYFHRAYMQITVDLADYLREFEWRIVNARGDVVAKIPESQINGTNPETVIINLRPGTYRLEASMRWWFHVEYINGNSISNLYGGWGNPFAQAIFDFVPTLGNNTSSGGTSGGTSGGMGGS